MGLTLDRGSAQSRSARRIQPPTSPYFRPPTRIVIRCPATPSAAVQRFSHKRHKKHKKEPIWFPFVLFVPFVANPLLSSPNPFQFVGELESFAPHMVGK